MRIFSPQTWCGDGSPLRRCQKFSSTRWRGGSDFPAGALKGRQTMKRSTQRILTTHVGSLARPDSLTPLLRLKETAQPYDREELARQVRESVRDVVQKQIEAGIDIV